MQIQKETAEQCPSEHPLTFAASIQGPKAVQPNKFSSNAGSSDDPITFYGNLLNPNCKNKFQRLDSTGQLPDLSSHAEEGSRDQENPSNRVGSRGSLSGALGILGLKKNNFSSPDDPIQKCEQRQNLIRPVLKRIRKQSSDDLLDHLPMELGRHLSAKDSMIEFSFRRKVETDHTTTTAFDDSQTIEGSKKIMWSKLRQLMNKRSESGDGEMKIENFDVTVQTIDFTHLRSYMNKGNLKRTSNNLRLSKASVEDRDIPSIVDIYILPNPTVSVQNEVSISCPPELKESQEVQQQHLQPVKKDRGLLVSIPEQTVSKQRKSTPDLTPLLNPGNHRMSHSASKSGPLNFLNPGKSFYNLNSEGSKKDFGSSILIGVKNDRAKDEIERQKSQKIQEEIFSEEQDNRSEGQSYMTHSYVPGQSNFKKNCELSSSAKNHFSVGDHTSNNPYNGLTSLDSPVDHNRMLMTKQKGSNNYQREKTNEDTTASPRKVESLKLSSSTKAPKDKKKDPAITPQNTSTSSKLSRNYVIVSLCIFTLLLFSLELTSQLIFSLF